LPGGILGKEPEEPHDDLVPNERLIRGASNGTISSVISAPTLLYSQLTSTWHWIFLPARNSVNAANLGPK
jgi:hypothetical protein